MYKTSNICKVFIFKTHSSAKEKSCMQNKANSCILNIKIHLPASNPLNEKFTTSAKQQIEKSLQRWEKLWQKFRISPPIFPLFAVTPAQLFGKNLIGYFSAKRTEETEVGCHSH